MAMASGSRNSSADTASSTLSAPRPNARRLGSHDYDSDAFDSMAVLNSELWSEEDDQGLTRSDLLPQGPQGLSREALGDAFLRAAQSGLLDVVRELVTTYGPEILDTTDEDHYTALHRAAYNGHLETAEFLLSAGARVDARTADGWQPLHCACRWNKTGVASLLLQNGADVNAQTNGGQTPLHLAASNSRAKPSLELLLRCGGVDPSLRNGQDQTAYEVARRSGPWSYLFEMTEEAVDWRKFAT